MPQYYTHLANFPEISELFVNQAPLLKYNNVEVPNHPTVHEIIAPNNFKQTRFCQGLNQHFGIEVTSSFVRTMPMTSFDWRADFGSQCAITFVLTETPHLVYFLENTDTRLNVPIEAMTPHYRLPTVVDATRRHCVVNYSDQPRYMLHVGIKTVPYQEVKQYLESLTVDASIYNVE